LERGTFARLEALTDMSNIRWLLHRIPEPSIRLFLALALFEALVVVSFAMLTARVM
jgi:hypothetical protein